MSHMFGNSLPPERKTTNSAAKSNFLLLLFYGIFVFPYVCCFPVFFSRFFGLRNHLRINNNQYIIMALLLWCVTMERNIHIISFNTNVPNTKKAKKKKIIKSFSYRWCDFWLRHHNIIFHFVFVLTIQLSHWIKYIKDKTKAQKIQDQQ